MVMEKMKLKTKVKDDDEDAFLSASVGVQSAGRNDAARMATRPLPRSSH